MTDPRSTSNGGRGPQPVERQVALLWLAAEKRFFEAVEGDHDGTCSGAGCGKCFLVGVEPLLDALRAALRGDPPQQEPSEEAYKAAHAILEPRTRGEVSLVERAVRAAYAVDRPALSGDGGRQDNIAAPDSLGSYGVDEFVQDLGDGGTPPLTIGDHEESDDAIPLNFIPGESPNRDPAKALRERGFKRINDPRVGAPRKRPTGIQGEDYEWCEKHDERMFWKDGSDAWFCGSCMDEVDRGTRGAAPEREAK